MVINNMDCRRISSGWCYNWNFSINLGNAHRAEIKYKGEYYYGNNYMFDYYSGYMGC